MKFAAILLLNFFSTKALYKRPQTKVITNFYDGRCRNSDCQTEQSSNACQKVHRRVILISLHGHEALPRVENVDDGQIVLCVAVICVIVSCVRVICVRVPLSRFAERSKRCRSWELCIRARSLTLAQCRSVVGTQLVRRRQSLFCQHQGLIFENLKADY